MSQSTVPCRRRGAHRHTLTYVQPGHPQRRRQTLCDRCNSMHLWTTVAFAVLAQLEPHLDGAPVKWTGASGWLTEQAAALRTGGMARQALATLRRRAEKENDR